MDRNLHAETSNFIEYKELVIQTAFHEAGHAAAIYFYNKSNDLPPVFFQIITKEISINADAKNYNPLAQKQFIAKIEGGRLIQNHPASLTESRIDFNKKEHQAYHAAYQADIVNLLVGPLAEAKYVALRDDETFNPLLINTNALKYYGGTTDLDNVHHYLEYFLNNKRERENKLTKLFNKAFHFINTPDYWKATKNLAHYIIENKNKTISCEQAFSILDDI